MRGLPIVVRSPVKTGRPRRVEGTPSLAKASRVATPDRHQRGQRGPSPSHPQCPAQEGRRLPSQHRQARKHQVQGQLGGHPAQPRHPGPGKVAPIVVGLCVARKPVVGQGQVALVPAGPEDHRVHELFGRGVARFVAPPTPAPTAAKRRNPNTYKQSAPRATTWPARRPAPLRMRTGIGRYAADDRFWRAKQAMPPPPGTPQPTPGQPLAPVPLPTDAPPAKPARPASPDRPPERFSLRSSVPMGRPANANLSGRLAAS